MSDSEARSQRGEQELSRTSDRTASHHPLLCTLCSALLRIELRSGSSWHERLSGSNRCRLGLLERLVMTSRISLLNPILRSTASFFFHSSFNGVSTLTVEP